MGNKTDRLHSLLPKIFQSRYNTNWPALVGAIGEQDQFLADLLEQVQRQLFIPTAERPYLDRLAANYRIVRPKFIGMDDSTFRQYVPVMAYSPKQVKLVIDRLLDLFFFKESTTAYSQSAGYEPFVMADGDDLLYSIDEYNTEFVKFKSSEFTNIAAATAAEVAAAINRQTKYSFAIVYSDSISKRQFIRIFSNTIGSKGSVRLLGGLANIALQFEGFNQNAGNGTNTAWSITMVGDLVRMARVSGDSPGISALSVGDVIISSLSGSRGSFPIEAIDVGADAVYFRNLNGVPGTYTQTSSRDVKFFTPNKLTIYQRDRRAVAWEVSPGEITIEMPTSPPVVKRKLSGSIHLNGLISTVVARTSDTSLQINGASSWPSAGKFVLDQEMQLVTRHDSDNTVTTKTLTGRMDPKSQTYTYLSKVGDILTGITPDLPPAAGLNETFIASGDRTSGIYTIVTTGPHGLKAGEVAIVQGAVALSGFLVPPNGFFKITSVPNPTTIVCASPGDDGVLDPTVLTDSVRVERPGMVAANSKVMLLSSQTETRLLGPYMWDSKAKYVLSYRTAELGTQISRGNPARIITIGANELLPTGGKLVFDYGTEREEGPVRYFYKPTDTTLSLDPSYTFKFDHALGSSVTAVNSLGAHQVSTTGAEYAGYITDPAVGRAILEDLIRQVKSAGVFVNFIVRYPQQQYSSIDVYGSGQDPDQAILDLRNSV